MNGGPGRTRQLAPHARERLAYAVLEHLDNEDRGLATSGRPEKINWGKYTKGRSPLVKAIVAVQTECNGEPSYRGFVGRNAHVFKKTAKKWFMRKFQSNG